MCVSMQIAYCLYHLNPAGESTLVPREGALLRVAFDDRQIGYADCHPWPELGGLSLNTHLALLVEQKKTPLIERSLAFARIDAEARSAKRHLFCGLEIPKSHSLINHLSYAKEFEATEATRLKIKVGNDLEAESFFLRHWLKVWSKRNVKVFLDFNGKLSKEQFVNFLKKSSDFIENIEFFEDPFPFDPEQWRQLRQEHSILLAADHDSSAALDVPDSCDFLVVKPALQEVAPFFTSRLAHRQVIITSCLDHPIGQLAAAYSAAILPLEHKKLLKSCGFLSHQAYRSTPFSQRLSHKNGHLIPSLKGWGWGYEDLLEQLEWRQLI
jgi:o-succinylbenzoate synthase